MSFQVTQHTICDRCNGEIRPRTTDTEPRRLGYELNVPGRNAKHLHEYCVVAGELGLLRLALGEGAVVDIRGQYAG